MVDQRSILISFLPSFLTSFIRSLAFYSDCVPDSRLSVGFPGSTSGKEPACQCRRHKRQGSIPRSGSSPGGGHSNPLQYSRLENPLDRGAWWVIVRIVAKSQIQLSDFARTKGGRFSVPLLPEHLSVVPLCVPCGLSAPQRPAPKPPDSALSSPLSSWGHGPFL